jgi:hypothetical protein
VARVVCRLFGCYVTPVRPRVDDAITPCRPSSLPRNKGQIARKQRANRGADARTYPRVARIGNRPAALTDGRLAHGGVFRASPFGPMRCRYEQGATMDSRLPQNRTKTMLSRPQKRMKSMPSRANLRAVSRLWARPSAGAGEARRRSAAPVPPFSRRTQFRSKTATNNARPSDEGSAARGSPVSGKWRSDSSDRASSDKTWRVLASAM